MPKAFRHRKTLPKMKTALLFFQIAFRFVNQLIIIAFCRKRLLVVPRFVGHFRNRRANRIVYLQTTHYGGRFFSQKIPWLFFVFFVVLGVRHIATMIAKNYFNILRQTGHKHKYENRGDNASVQDFGLITKR